VIEAVGMEAAGSTLDSVLHATKVLADKLHALRLATRSVRRGGTLSISGVYLGWYPAFLIGDLFDRQITIRMGQANVRRWTDAILAHLATGSRVGNDLVTHEMPLDQAPRAYEMFQKKLDGAVKVILHPDGTTAPTPPGEDQGGSTSPSGGG
jgi:threonine dehydrogenase-like Zn-dependent dehydrogenase